MSNPYCRILGIDPPTLEAVKDHAEASSFTLLLVALLEQGGPMTLREVAARFEAAGIAPAGRALRSLQRSRPARAPVYRDGDDYSLDPHDDELDLWLFRLGLRPPRMPMLRVVPPPPEPLPGPEVPLTSAELEEAFRGAYLGTAWSAQRLALAVLDSHGGCLPAERVLDAMYRLTPHHRLRTTSARYWRRGAPVQEIEEGTWEMNPDHPALLSAREAVRERIAAERRRRGQQPDPAALAAHRRRLAARDAARAAELAELRRVLVHAFPPGRPEAMVLLDVAGRELETFLRRDFPAALERLAGYDVIAALEVRPLLQALGFDPGRRRLADLGPPQKTRKLNRRGRTLKITTPLLIRGTCDISGPLGDPAKLRQYLEQGQTTRLRRRLEADAKSLFALYQFGCLHGWVRLRWGFLDELLAVPWAYRGEGRIYHLMKEACERGAEMEVVVGAAPGWQDPWARAFRCVVVRDDPNYRYVLITENGFEVDDRKIQLARIVEPGL